jgi:hypothetical protein
MARYLFILLLGILLVNPARADSEGEIQHLLTYIEDSGCTFERNGRHYPAAEARSHIQKKFDYTQRWIKTTEDFIEYTATQSSISGKSYHVICQGKRQLSAHWLLAELKHYRSEKAASSAKD